MDICRRDLFNDLEIALSGEIMTLGVEKKCPTCQKPILALPSAKIFLVYETTA